MEEVAYHNSRWARWRCPHDHAPIGNVTAAEIAAYCRLHNIDAHGAPMLVKSEIRRGPHPASYRPDLALYSPLDNTAGRQPAVPAAWRKLTKEERATLIDRPLQYTKE